MKDMVMRVGIVGAGHIAEKAAATLGAMPQAECLAIASRSLEKAAAFAARFGIARAYGSYDELLDDPDIDLVYVALPHTLHYGVTRAAIERGKACLVEKAFMACAREAREVLGLARQRGVLVAEAIWSRYLPIQNLAREIIASGAIGRPLTLRSSLAYNVGSKERILSPALGGGALLDLGVYNLNFVRMFGGAPITRTVSHCIKFPTGTDASESIILELENGVLATIDVSATTQGCNISVVAGETGYLVFNDTIHPTRLSLMRKGHLLEKEWEMPFEINGFEYEFEACRQALISGEIELSQMPHEEIVLVMELMDSLRRSWGVTFPCD